MREETLVIQNKFRAAKFVFAGTLLLPIISIYPYILLISWCDPTTYTLGLDIVAICGMIVAPILLALWGFLIGFPMVTINEKGLHRSLLGKFFKKSILWKEIQDIRTIKTLGTAAMWIFFSKTNLEGMGITKCRLRRDNIFIVYSEELKETVKYYSGKDILI